ncbi:copper-binding protein (plasmid) [Ensifer adhaerens]|uniref:copper-binding protein n=1 Tax=Ensifer adhaerens TaxID=106592 RepID=UPI0023A948D9|nr:copper-binding protein [Ensifer adhaerens]WDZ79433.1 copper-binding protein [Ensifer adhaerens]
MNTAGKLFAALALAASTATFALPAQAAEFTKGIVKKVDTKAKKVTIDHEDLKNLDMPAMTMVFRVGDDAVLAKLKEGASIEFVADRVNGKLTVTEVK